MAELAWQVYPATQHERCDGMLALDVGGTSCELHCQLRPGHPDYCAYERLDRKQNGGFRVEWWRMEGMIVTAPAEGGRDG